MRLSDTIIGPEIAMTAIGLKQAEKKLSEVHANKVNIYYFVHISVCTEPYRTYALWSNNKGGLSE